MLEYNQKYGFLIDMEGSFPVIKNHGKNLDKHGVILNSKNKEIKCGTWDAFLYLQT